MYYLVYMSLTSMKMPLMMLVPGYQYQLRFCVHQFSNVWFLHIYSTSRSTVHDYPGKWLRPFGEELGRGGGLLVVVVLVPSSWASLVGRWVPGLKNGLGLETRQRIVTFYLRLLPSAF